MLDFNSLPLASQHALICAPGGPLEMKEMTVLGRPNIRVFVNAPPSIRALWESSKVWADAGHDYLIYAEHGKPDIRVTYKDGHRITAQVAHALLNGYQGKGKIVKGDRVSIVMRNLTSWPHCFWATTSVGAIASCVNAWLTGPEMSYCIGGIRRVQRPRDC